MPSDDLRKDSIGALRVMGKTCMPTLPSRRSDMNWVFHASEP
jgi:hypothetical protein